jgi:magnesium chelatase family protein
VATRVAQARQVAGRRGAACNAELPGRDLDVVAPLSDGAAALLGHHFRTGLLSARGLHRVRRVARTVADLHGAPTAIDELHVAEALALRAARSAIAVGVPA